MQTTITCEPEKIDRIFKIDINGKAVPCAEVHVKRAVPENAHKEIKAFYTRLCEEFIAYAEKALAPEFAERYTAAKTLRERCALKLPVLSISINAQGDDPISIITEYTLFYGARAEKKNEIRTDWDARRGIVVKKRANKKRST